MMSMRLGNTSMLRPGKGSGAGPSHSNMEDVWESDRAGSARIDSESEAEEDSVFVGDRAIPAKRVGR